MKVPNSKDRLMQAASNGSVASPGGRRWWREPMMWLVVGGPLLVVVAGIATMVLAVRAPDPLVASDYYRRGLEINKTLAEQQEATPLPEGLRPALQARNHAATPVQKP